VYRQPNGSTCQPPWMARLPTRTQPAALSLVALDRTGPNVEIEIRFETSVIAVIASCGGVTGPRVAGDGGPSQVLIRSARETAQRGWLVPPVTQYATWRCMAHQE
jgi:hypothetical protein